MFTRPPAEFEGKFGSYRSPLKFADDSIAKTPASWARRREEILKIWHKPLGPWPPRLERPVIKRLETINRDGYIQQRMTLIVETMNKEQRVT